MTTWEAHGHGPTVSSSVPSSEMGLPGAPRELLLRTPSSEVVYRASSSGSFEPAEMSLGSPAMRTAFSPVPIDGMGFSPSPVANNLAFGAPTFLPVLPVLENPVPVPQPVPAPVPQQLPPTPPMPAQMPPMLAPPTFLITPPGLAEGGIGVQPTNSYGYGVPAPLPPAPPLSAPFQQPPTLPHSLGSPNQRPSPNTLPAALPATNPHYVLINGRPTAVDGSWATEQLGQFHPQLGMNVPAPFGVADPAIYGGDGAFEPGVYVEPAPSILPTRIFSGSSRWVRCLTVDVEGTVLFAGGDDAKIRLWDLMTGQRQRTLKGHGQPVYSLVQDPGTGTVFSGALDGALLAHDPRVSRPVASYKVHTDALKSLVLKKDGTRLYSAGYDGRLAEWDPRYPTPRLLLRPSPIWLRSLVLDPSDLHAYLVDSSKAIKCIHLPSGNTTWLQRADTEPFRTLHLDSAGRFLYSGGQDASVVQWDAMTGEPQGSLDSHRGWVTSVVTDAMEPRRLFTASNDTTIKEWDLGRGTLTTTWEPKSGPIETLVLDPLGRPRMWTTGQDGGVREFRVPQAWWLLDEEGEDGIERSETSSLVPSMG